MPLKYYKVAFCCALFVAVFTVQPVSANAPDVKVNVVVENSGVTQPVGGAFIRWRNRCGGSYGYKCEYNDATKTPRRYGKTKVDGAYTYEKFQTANMSQEAATTMEGLIDPDYPGVVKMVQPGAGSKFGCGQVDHKIAVMAPGYVCDQYKSENGPYQKISCPNGWCEGVMNFENDCTNGCPLKTYTFKCKAQTINDAGREVKRSEVGLGSDDPAAEKNADWGFSCAQTQFCTDPASTTSIPASQKNNYTTCENYPSTAAGAVKKRVKLVGMQSLYDKSYIQKQSEGIPAYIVECINLSGKYQCTTGNTNLDQKVFGKNNVPAGYSIEMYKGSTNKQLANPVTYQQLDEDIVAISTYSSPITSFFMLVYPQDKQTAVNVGSSSGQQQATLSNRGECRIIQDPYGRVFDSYTLEPLSNASVELTKKTASGQYVKAGLSDSLIPLVNPQTTKENGSFSFNVIDGTYKLSAKKDTYVFSPIYTPPNDLANEMFTNIYTGEDIIQKGSAVHKDIPLEPQNKQLAEEYAKTNPIKILNYLQSINKDKKTYVIEGDVTHPKAMVVVYATIHKKDGQVVRGEALTRTDADLFGHFTLSFPLKKIKGNETVGQLETVKKKYANKDTITLEPLFDSVKGYAYDQTGKLIPGAKVAVMVPFSNVPVFKTTADAKGFFQIASQQLPPIGYSFVFTSLNGVAETVSTNSFIAQNVYHENSNRLFALNPPDDTAVLGESTMNGSPLSTGQETADTNSKILVGAFILLLLMAIPLSRMYTEKDEKKKRK